MLLVPSVRFRFCVGGVLWYCHSGIVTRKHTIDYSRLTRLIVSTNQTQSYHEEISFKYEFNHK